MNTGTFTLTLHEFQGPLGLLLDLVERHKLPINNISLAHIADDYIRYIENKENIPLAETTSFVLVASTLLLIKSKSLLPKLAMTTEEDDDITELEQRLHLYMSIRTCTKLLRPRWKKQSFLRLLVRAQHEVLFAPTKDITKEALNAACRKVLDEMPTLTKTPVAHMHQEINLEDIISKLDIRIRNTFKSSFMQVTSQATKVEYIVHFLALLELVKRGTITAHQCDTFADIQMEKEGISTPIYG